MLEPQRGEVNYSAALRLELFWDTFQGRWPWLKRCRTFGAAQIRDRRTE
jgi:hypothetical protein